MNIVTLWHVAVLCALVAVNVAVFGVPGVGRGWSVEILVWLLGMGEGR